MGQTIHGTPKIITREHVQLCFVTPFHLKKLYIRGVPSDWLTPTEFAHFKKIHAESRRRDWLAGRLAAKELIQHWLQWFSLAQIEITNDEAGAPVVHLFGDDNKPVPVLSISHSEGHGLAGLIQKGCIGVDLQEIRPVRPGLRERVLNGHELEQLTNHFDDREEKSVIVFWALKEAATKAQHARPTQSYQEIEVNAVDPGRTEVRIRGKKLSACWGQREGFIWACAFSDPFALPAI